MEWVWGGLGGLLGLCAGSFANVFLHRYPRGESLFSPPSHCPSCGRGVRWRHNVPLLGWLVLRGRCHDCRAPISWTYPAVEASFGALGALLPLRFGHGPAVWAYLALFWALLLAALADWKTQYLYDVITLPLLAAGLAFSFAFPAALGGRWQAPLACFCVLAGMLVLRGLGEWLFGREAMGAGDVKLMAAAACWLGPARCWAAFWAAGLFGLPLLLLFKAVRGGSWSDPTPFGPALALGCGVAAWRLLAGAPAFPLWP